MGKTRSMLLIIVINIFLMLLVSVLLEYVNLSERLSLLEDNVSVALDRSIDAATASEELFTSKYQELMASRGLTGGGDGGTGVVTSSNHEKLGANMIVWDDKHNMWFEASSYLLAAYYDTYNKLPESASEFEAFYNSVGSASGTRAVYNWLFGLASHNYSTYYWANKSEVVTDALAEAQVPTGNRKPNADFKDFYDKIGKSIRIVGVVKARDGEYDYKSCYRAYPVLDNMGLAFGDNCTGRGNDGDEKYVQYMTDNFCMSAHAGKVVNNNTTEYYLTPYSLGVTYVPLKVLKPVFMGNLDTMVRLQRVSSGGLTNLAEYSNASVCALPSVYDGPSFTQQLHARSAATENHHIVSDGNIEYDLDSIQFRVDYYTADFYSENYKNIAARIEGALTASDNDSNRKVSNQEESLNLLVKRLQESDTYNGTKTSANVNGNRIVAKVTVRMKVYILYNSSILQWVSYKDWVHNGCKGDWHAAIKEINPKTGMVLRDNDNNFGSDGVWYQYSTYFAVTR